MALQALASLFGGGGLSASSSATSGDAKGGAVGISVGGINTGTQEAAPSLLMLAAAAVGLYLVLRK
jgi:hypothetical protein